MSAPDGSGQLPNLVLAGVTKAGTTSLFAYLAQHPDLFAATTKELNYFSPLVHDRPLAPLDEYRAHFRDAGSAAVRLDASPFYFVGAQRVAEAIAGTLDRPKILISLRNPVARLWSSYTYKKSKGYVPRDARFADWFAECRAQFDSGADLSWEHRDALTLRTGRYADFLPAWTERFGDDLLVVFAEDLADRPRDVLSRTFGWLGIDDCSATLDYTRRNTTRQSRSVALRTVGHRVNMRLKPVLTAHPRLQRALHSGYARLNTADSDETLSDTDRAAVRAFYADSTARLGALLEARGQRGLPAWVGAGAGS